MVRGTQAKRLTSRPRSVRATLMLPLRFTSRSRVCCVIGRRLLSTKLRYSEVTLALLKSRPNCASSLGFKATPTSNPMPGALKSVGSTVSWLVTKSYQSLPARANSQLPRTVTEPAGSAKKKSGAGRGLGGGRRFWAAAGPARVREQTRRARHDLIGGLRMGGADRDRSAIPVGWAKAAPAELLEIYAIGDGSVRFRRQLRPETRAKGGVRLQAGLRTVASARCSAGPCARRSGATAARRGRSPRSGSADPGERRRTRYARGSCQGDPGRASRSSRCRRRTRRSARRAASPGAPRAAPRNDPAAGR